MIRTFIHIALVIILFANQIQSQDLNLIARANIGAGFDYLTQDFNGLKTFYSPGGGLGIEAGMEGELQNDLYWYGTFGLTINLDFHYEEIQGRTTKTSFSWNKKFITGGVNKYIEFRNKYVDNFYGGGGLMLGFPGILRRTENGGFAGSNGYKGRITYKPSIGFQLHVGGTLDIGRDFVLRPEIRYRYIVYQAKNYTHGRVDRLEDGLRKARADGIEVGLTIVKQIKGGRY